MISALQMIQTVGGPVLLDERFDGMYEIVLRKVRPDKWIERRCGRRNVDEFAIAIRDDGVGRESHERCEAA
jgi:hypothetical protein